MTVKKLESSNNQAIITEEVSILKKMLEEITRQMVGDASFAKIEKIIDLSAKEDDVQLNDLISQLTNEEMVIVSRYF